MAFIRPQKVERTGKMTGFRTEQEKETDKEQARDWYNSLRPGLEDEVQPEPFGRLPKCCVLKNGKVVLRSKQK